MCINSVDVGVGVEHCSQMLINISVLLFVFLNNWNEFSAISVHGLMYMVVVCKHVLDL